MLSKVEENHKLLTTKQEYTAYRETSGIPFKNRIKGRDKYIKFVGRYFEKLSEKLIETETGVFVPRVGYFFIWKTPLTTQFRKFSKTKKNNLLKGYNFGINKNIHLVTYVPVKTVDHFMMDKTFSAPIKKAVKDKLTSGYHYKTYLSTLKKDKENMNNIEAIIAQVLSEYNEHNSKLDEDVLYREAVLATKSLGKLSTDLYEEVIEVKNGVADLPSNFYKAELLLECDEHNSSSAPIEYRTLINTDYVVELDFLETKWLDCEACCKETSYKSFEKNVFIKKTQKGTQCFGKFNPIMITPHSIKSNCLPSCINKSFNCHREVSFDYRRLKMMANFDEGFVYIKYKGFPIDEEGNFDFDDTANGNMERFVEFTLKVKIAEILMAYPGTSHIVNLLQYFEQQKRYYRTKASQEKVMETYDDKRFERKVKNKNRMDYNKLSGYNR